MFRAGFANEALKDLDNVIPLPNDKMKDIDTRIK